MEVEAKNRSSVGTTGDFRFLESPRTLLAPTFGSFEYVVMVSKFEIHY